jgi:proteasome lid subunit RPN8/RPN11
VRGLASLGLPKTVSASFEQRAKQTNDELCGILVGTFGNFSGVVTEIRVVKNIHATPRKAFLMDPQEFLNAIEDTSLYTATPKQQFLGIIHSHPIDYAFPSITDWAAAEGHGLYFGPYLIYSPVYEKLNGFFWDGRQFLRIDVHT